MKNKILLFQRIIPHYRKDFFLELINISKKNILIIYGNEYKGETLNSIDIDNNNLLKIKNYYLYKNIYLSHYLKYIKKYKPKSVLIPLELNNLNLMYLILLKYKYKYKIYLWTFGYDPFKGFKPYKNIKDLIRLFYYKISDGNIFYWDKGKKEVEKYLKNKNNIVVNNTLNLKKLFLIKNKISKIDKNKLKEEFNIKSKYNIIYVGRLIEDKKVDLLIKSFKNIDKSDILLHIVGEGPLANNLKELSKKLDIKNIKFWGGIYDEEKIGKLLYLCDVHVHLGRLGLTVIHSFIFETPIISQNFNKYYHGDGLQYIKNNYNSFLISPNNIDELLEKINLIRKKEFNIIKNNCFKTAEQILNNDVITNFYNFINN